MQCIWCKYPSILQSMYVRLLKKQQEFITYIYNFLFVGKGNNVASPAKPCLPQSTL